jgi:hypothetical protein
VEIGEDQGVGEHEQVTGKLVRALAEVEEVRWELPTGGWCTAGEERDGGGGMWLGYGKLDAGSNRTAGGSGCSATARERERVNAPGWPVHGDQEVAAGDGSGTSWRAWEKPPGERKGVGIKRK